MSAFKVVITDHGFADIETERLIIEAAGGTLAIFQCKTLKEVMAACRGATALLVQYAPITAEVLATLDECKLIVRYGIGTDNIDLAAATACNIPICNVPDYGIDEVADHSVALALALSRHLQPIDQRVRKGIWKMAPDGPMPAFREMVFATAGFGRIGRAVLNRARGFKFQLVSYDPYVDAEAMKKYGVKKLTLDELFSQVDILSLHLPYTTETHHLVNAERLQQMGAHAVLVNTARGALIDTRALASALKKGEIAFAGLDVFEEEPLPCEHPLRSCPNALLSSHLAWFSDSSLPLLQKLAAEEIVRGVRGETLRNLVSN